MLRFLVLCLVVLSFEPFGQKMGGQKRGQMVKSILSKNDAIQCPLLLIYHTNSPYYIQWHCVIAYLQNNKDNLWGVLDAYNSHPDSINKHSWTNEIWTFFGKWRLWEWWLSLCVFFVMPLISDHFDYCKDKIWLDYTGNTVAKSPITPMQPMASQRKHTNPLTTLTIFFSQTMFNFYWRNSAYLLSQGSNYLHKEHVIACLYLVSNMQWQSTIGYSVGNWHNRSRT